MTPADPEFAALRALSARLGRDPLRTQAAGGNTSLKHDGILWIKASGTWLADAATGDIFVPVRLDPLLKAVEDADPRAEKATDFVATEMAANPALRPSVETSVHAVIDRRVVVHIHDVATTAIAVREDAEEILRRRLTPAGIDWLFVPYVKPGVPLSRAIAERIGAGTNAIILGNHGLVVMADTVAEAGALADRAAAALEVTPRPAPSGDIQALARLAEGTPYRLPKDPVAHATAGDKSRLAIAERGSLYPDHVVFLGPGTVVKRVGDGLKTRGRRPETLPMMVVIPETGVLLRESALPGADELARALADVTARIDPATAIRVLTSEQERDLISWDAELYRQKVAREAGQRP